MIDYVDGPVFDVEPGEVERHLAGAREMSMAFVYWLQTEPPRPDGGTGLPGLRLRPDVMGTPDGLAMAPYIRESRRIAARYTVVEQDVSLAVRGERGAKEYADSVGVGIVPHRPAPVDRRRQLHRRGIVPVPDPAGRAAAGADDQPGRGRRRTSARPTSPTAVTGCTRRSGTSASPRACSPRTACATRSRPTRSATGVRTWPTTSTC